jgi:chitinase
VWYNATACVSGNKISYNGDNWTANQWNYDEVPGGPAGAWNNDEAC